MKKIKIISLGGTISYIGSTNKYLNAYELSNQIDGLSKIANISHTSFINKSSSSLLMQDILDLANYIRLQTLEGIDAFVVTQGTDNIEETSFMLDILLGTSVPVIVTGAMKNPQLLGADGLANLMSSVELANSKEVEGFGVLVCFNDEIHLPLFVRKTHTQNINTFKSEFGPIGWLAEGKPRIVLKFIDLIEEGITDLDDIEPSVCLYTTYFNDDGRLLKNIVSSNYKGLVIEGMGGGHVPSFIAQNVIQIAKEIPVILASRTPNGEVLNSTYSGYEGSETYLLNNGLISAGFLDSRKARVLLTILLEKNYSIQEVKRIFSKYSTFT